MRKKMYPKPKALTELNRLDKISHNKNSTKWEKVNNELIKVSSLNCRSLNKHYQDIVTDHILLKGDFIGLQETWLTSDESRETLEIPGYNLHINSMGKELLHTTKEIFLPSSVKSQPSWTEIALLSLFPLSGSASASVTRKSFKTTIS